MPIYRDKYARGQPDDLLVIEDVTVRVRDGGGVWRPSFRYVDDHTIRAHPLIIDVLLKDAERLWSLGEVLGVIESECR